MNVRPTLLAAALVALGTGAAAALAGERMSAAATLAPSGIGRVRFGLPKQEAVAKLSALFGAPSARGGNTGCGPRYTEVDWGDLVAEFRLGRFSGFRYIEGGYPLTTPGSPREPAPLKTVVPRLATSTGVSLGSTLGQLRAAYGTLRLVTADSWRAANGLSSSPTRSRPRRRHASSRSRSEPAATSKRPLFS